MKNTFFVLFLVVFQISFGQDVYEKMSKSICKCMEKEQIKSMPEMQPCFEQIVIKNLSEILAYHNIKSMSEIKGSEVGSRLTAKLAANCDYALNLVKDSIQSKLKKHEPDTVLNCDGISLGEYYYLTYNSSGELTDTTYVTFTESEYIERMKNGKTYSRLGVKWKNKCNFVLTFIESNDPLKSELSKVGTKYEYEVIKNNDHSMVLRNFWKKTEQHIQYIKIK